MSEFTAKKLKEARVRAGFTQDEAAKLMNLKKTTMSEMEAGKILGDVCEIKPDFPGEIQPVDHAQALLFRKNGDKSSHSPGSDRLRLIHILTKGHEIALFPSGELFTCFSDDIGKHSHVNYHVESLPS